MSSKINIRKIELKDYEFINKWWVKQGFKIPNKDILPNEGFGGVIIEKEKPIAAAYLYLTNSKTGYIDNLISNPDYKSKDRFDIIQQLIDALVNSGINSGCKIVWATSAIDGVINKCRGLGYEISKEKHSIIYKKQ
jgi:hypothetical protein